MLPQSLRCIYFCIVKNENIMSGKNWNRLDNAALIYTSLLSDNYATNFRLSLTMDEDVDKDILNQSLQACIDRFPSFRYALRKGLYWWYMRTIERDPSLKEFAPLSARPFNDRDGYLFQLSAEGRVICLDVFHSLADGTGALTFLLTIAGEYVKRTTGKHIDYSSWVLDPASEVSEEEWADGFDSFNGAKGSLESAPAAYHVKGRSLKSGGLANTRISMPSEDLVSRSKLYGCTVTELLTSVMIKALQDVRNLDRRSKKNPHIKVSVPVNLRGMFGKRTLRNFSSYVNLGVDVSYGDYSLTEIIEEISLQKRIQTSPRALTSKVSANVMLENNLPLRCVPLSIKKPVIATVGRLKGDRFNTQTMSNIGNVVLPEAMKPHILDIDFQLGKQFANFGAASCVSCNGRTTINCSRKIQETEFERFFVYELRQIGLDPEVTPALGNTGNESETKATDTLSSVVTFIPRGISAASQAVVGSALVPLGLLMAVSQRVASLFGPYFMI